MERGKDLNLGEDDVRKLSLLNTLGSSRHA